MKVQSSSMIFGLFLICVGILFLLGSLGYINITEGRSTAIVFSAAGITLICAYIFINQKIWSLILGAVSLFIGSAIIIDSLRSIPNEYIGISLFCISGLVFLNSLRRGRKNWWALIPGGFCFIMAGHIIIDMVFWRASYYHGIFFFGGSAIIFCIIYLLKNQEYKLGWAKIPGIICFIIALVIFAGSDWHHQINRLVLPVILIILGFSIVYRAFQSDHNQKMDADKTAGPELPAKEDTESE